MKQLVLTIIGKDKAGLVEQLSSVINQHQGNWMASNLSHLAGYFAGIVQLEVAEQDLEPLCHALANVTDLDIRVQQGEQTSLDKAQQLRFVITGNDRPGIVRELSAILSHKGANIVAFESSKQSAPNWGSPLFHAQATVQLPAGISPQDITSALEAIATDIIVDLE